MPNDSVSLLGNYNKNKFEVNLAIKTTKQEGKTEELQIKNRNNCFCE